ncbi:hypothetical protein ACQEVC_22495 [Plantactinospora sp. CA-294935]|uniref:hypothetical protein n=1 Tax=Plantactinospora sp. CA-294935 TaxID=3240012 RepID=UPI003D8CA422
MTTSRSDGFGAVMVAAGLAMAGTLVAGPTATAVTTARPDREVGGGSTGGAARQEPAPAASAAPDTPEPRPAGSGAGSGRGDPIGSDDRIRR